MCGTGRDRAYLIGVILLFVFGMPFRAERKGAGYLMREETDHDAIRTEQWFRVLGYAGLALVIVGSGLQMIAVLIA
jgi:hypothetical protein